MVRTLKDIMVGEIFTYGKDTYLKVTEHHLYWFNSEDFYKIDTYDTEFEYPSLGYVAEGLQ